MSNTVMGKMNELGDKLSMTNVRSKSTEFGKMNELLKYEASEGFDFNVFPTNKEFYGDQFGYIGSGLIESTASIPAGSIIRFHLSYYNNPSSSYARYTFKVSSNYWNVEDLNSDVLINDNGFLHVKLDGSNAPNSTEFYAPWLYASSPITIEISYTTDTIEQGVPCAMIDSIEWVHVDNDYLQNKCYHSLQSTVGLKYLEATIHLGSGMYSAETNNSTPTCLFIYTSKPYVTSTLTATGYLGSSKIFNAQGIPAVTSVASTSYIIQPYRYDFVSTIEAFEIMYTGNYITAYSTFIS